MSITIRNFVVMGTAVPERLKDGRNTVCTAGYNEDLGFVRIYPTSPKMGLHRWDILDVEVEGNSRDSRFESWKLVGGDEPVFKKTGSVKPVDKVKLLSFLSEQEQCVKDINYKNLSLGVVKAHKIKAKLVKNELFKPRDIKQEKETKEKYIMTRNDFPYTPRISFSCGNGCKAKAGHDQMVLEWGAYEWMRKHPNNIEQLLKNWKIGDPEYDFYFLVGNTYQHRGSFIIISVIPVKNKQLSLSLIENTNEITINGHHLQKRIGYANTMARQRSENNAMLTQVAC